MSGGARRGSPASSALSLLLLIAPLLAFAPAALASVPRGATALSSPSLAADVGALAAPPLEHTESAAFRVFVGDELGDAHVLVFELSYPKTRVGGLGLPDEARVEDERSLRLEAPWACDERSGGKASGSGEFRIFDPANAPRSASAFGWNRLFQGREHLGFVDAYDFRARALWPELGRFGQEDPLGTVDSPNLYQALRGNWTTYIDPWGLITFVNPTIGRDDVFGQLNLETGNSFVDFWLLSPINNLFNAGGGLVNTALNSLYGPLRALGWTDTDIEALNLYLVANPAEVQWALAGLRSGAAQASVHIEKVLERLRAARAERVAAGGMLHPERGAVVLGGARRRPRNPGNLAGSQTHLVNASIGELRGFSKALEQGHLGIRGPGNASIPGRADFVTWDPKAGQVVLWDAKYRGPGGRYPSSVPPDRVTAWTKEAREAIDAMADGPIKTAAREALERGDIRGEIMKWPQ